jgi:hypothetical protein
MDLRNAIYCLEIENKNRGSDELKIGIVTKDFPGEFPFYNQGEVVVYREHLEPPCTQMGEYRGVEQKPNGSLTVETPLSIEEIIKRRKDGNFITTVRTMTFVLARYVMEIKL